MCSGNKFFLLGNKNVFGVKNIFASRTQILRPKFSHPGKHIIRNIVSRNNVSKLIKALTLGDLNLLIGDLSFSVSRQKVPSVFLFLYFEPCLYWVTFLAKIGVTVFAALRSGVRIKGTL